MGPRKRRSSTFERHAAVDKEPAVAQTPRRLTLKPPAPAAAAAAPQTPGRLTLNPPAPPSGRLMLKPPQAPEQAEERPPPPKKGGKVSKPAAKKASKKASQRTKQPSLQPEQSPPGSIDESLHAARTVHSSMPPLHVPSSLFSSQQSSSALFLRARAQKAIDLVPDTPSRTSIALFRHNLLEEDDDSDGAGPETQLSNTQTYFNTQQPQIRRHSSESLFVGVEGEPNKRWTQARKEISRREDVFGEGDETPKDIDILQSQPTAGQ